MIIAPEIMVLIIALIVIVVDTGFTRSESVLQGITTIGLLIAIVIALLTDARPGGAFGNMVSADSFTIYFKIVLLVIAFLTALISRNYLTGQNYRLGEYYSLILMSTVGMMILASAENMITLFMGLETMSIALYVLAGYRTESLRSNEAALKYFLLGALSTGFLLYGIALVYGATGGQTGIAEINLALQGYSTSSLAPIHLTIGIGLIMVALLFKVAAMPFHFWSPDVYQGAPTPVTAFMSAGPKAAALIAFLKLFGWAFSSMGDVWVPILSIVAAATMIGGNIIALSQRNIKRMLAYSSISHAGYLLIGIIAAANVDIRNDAASGMFFYLTAYYLMNIGAFSIAILINSAVKKGDYQIDDYRGLSQSHPWIAGGMALFMISLAGIPPTAGFFGKFYLFSAAIKADLIVLVIIGVLMSVVSAFYYLRIVVYMFMKPQADSGGLQVKLTPAYMLVLVICVVGILKLGIFPGPLMKVVDSSSDKIGFVVGQHSSPISLSSK